MTIGEKIKEVRKRKGMTQKELSEKIGVSVPTLQRYENESSGLNIEKLNKLAKALDISKDDYQEMMISYGMFFDDVKLKSESELKKHYEPLINTACVNLNSIGCKKVYDYASDLLKISEYQTSDYANGITHIDGRAFENKNTLKFDNDGRRIDEKKER